MPTTPTPSHGPADGPQGPRWDRMTPGQFGRREQRVQTALFPEFDTPAPDACGTLDLLSALTPDPCTNCDSDDRAQCGCCPACDTLKDERCLVCGSCRCDTHEDCDQVAAARTALAGHQPAVRNDYGSCIRPGFIVTEGRGDTARVHHQLPNLSMSDPNRRSSTERWHEQRARVEEYAVTLEAAGWAVQRKNVTTGPILLAAHPARRRPTPVDVPSPSPTPNGEARA